MMTSINNPNDWELKPVVFKKISGKDLDYDLLDMYFYLQEIDIPEHWTFKQKHLAYDMMVWGDSPIKQNKEVMKFLKDKPWLDDGK